MLASWESRGPPWGDPPLLWADPTQLPAAGCQGQARLSGSGAPRDSTVTVLQTPAANIYITRTVCTPGALPSATRAAVPRRTSRARSLSASICPFHRWGSRGTERFSGPSETHSHRRSVLGGEPVGLTPGKLGEGPPSPTETPQGGGSVAGVAVQASRAGVGRVRGNSPSCQEGAAAGALPARPGLAREAEICR